MKKTSRGKDTPLVLGPAISGLRGLGTSHAKTRVPRLEGPGFWEPVCPGCTGFPAASAAAKENSHSRGGMCWRAPPEFPLTLTASGASQVWVVHRCPAASGHAGWNTFFRPNLWKTIPGPQRAPVQGFQAPWEAHLHARVARPDPVFKGSPPTFPFPASSWAGYWADMWGSGLQMLDSHKAQPPRTAPPVLCSAVGVSEAVCSWEGLGVGAERLLC